MRNKFLAFVHAVRFSSVTVALAVISWGYFGINLVTPVLIGLCALYATFAGAAVCNACVCDRLFRGSSAFVLSGRTQHIIRDLVNLIQIPVLLFSAAFCWNLSCSDLSFAGLQHRESFVNFENAVFGRSALTQILDASTGKVDFSAFVDQMQERIKSNWHPASADRSIKTVVKYHVSPIGEVQSLRLVETNGSGRDFAAAMEAIAAAVPFEHMPAGAYYAQDVVFTFQTHVGYEDFGKE